MYCLMISSEYHSCMIQNISNSQIKDDFQEIIMKANSWKLDLHYLS